MRLQPITIFFFTLLTFSLSAQNMADYTDSWEGKIENSKTFNFTVSIAGLQSETGVFKISNDKNIIEQSFEVDAKQLIKIPINENLSFEGSLSESGKVINGFMKSGLLLYHLKLTKIAADYFTGSWNILMVNELKSQNFYLSVENGSGDEYQAYPILTDNRFTGTWCANFQKKKDSITFEDFKTKEHFVGKKYVEYWKSNSNLYESVNQNGTFDFKVFEKSASENDLILFGEYHGTKEIIDIDFQFIKYLNEKVGMKTHIAEIDFSQAYFLNEYLKNGNDSIIEYVLNSWIINKEGYSLIKRCF